MKLFFTTTLLFILASCASQPAPAPAQAKEYRSPIFEERLDKMRQGYLSECVAPVYRKEYSEKECTFKLLTALERSHGVNYNEVQLFRKANAIFFETVEHQMLGVIGTQNKMARQLKRAFRTPNDAMDYFKKEYALKPEDI